MWEVITNIASICSIVALPIAIWQILDLKSKVKRTETSIKRVLEIKEYQKNQEIKEVAKFDHFKMILTAVVAALAAISTLSLWLEPSIKVLMQILF